LGEQFLSTVMNIMSRWLLCATHENYLVAAINHLTLYAAPNEDERLREFEAVQGSDCNILAVSATVVPSSAIRFDRR
jgi:hypothetical protein